MNIRPHCPDEIAERPADPHPGPDLIDGEEEYKVEKILDSKWLHRNLWYLVKYTGWLHSENQWLTRDHLTHAPDLVEEFHRTHPHAPGRERENPPAASRRNGLRRGGCQGTPGLTPPPLPAPRRFPPLLLFPLPFLLLCFSLFLSVPFVPFVLYFSTPILWTTFLLSMYRRCACTPHAPCPPPLVPPQPHTAVPSPH